MKKVFLFIIIYMMTISVNSQNSILYLKTCHDNISLQDFGDVLNEYLKEGYYVKMMRGSSYFGNKCISAFLSNDSQGEDIESYVFVYLYDYYAFKLSGDLPAGMERYYYNPIVSKFANQLFEELQKNGFQLELFDAADTYEYFLLAKRKSGSTSVRENNSDEDKIEMARYNLEGIPVDKSYKGIQIIVYSNFTTKVVNVN